MKRLSRLDSKVIPGLRQPGEDAETYLRRVAAGRGPGGNAQAAEVGTALREYFRDLDAK